MHIVRIGTRKSKLAFIQANLVINEIMMHFPKLQCELIPIITNGDKILDQNLHQIGGKALFVKELEQSLIDNKIDIAIHSMKDIPGQIPHNLEIRAVLAREDPREVFISPQYKTFNNLPFASKIGTSSVRRQILLHNQRPDIKFVLLRGNVDTRMNKILTNQIDGSVLSAAGLKRLGLLDLNYCTILETHEMIPATGQGVIALEINKSNDFARDICDKVNHKETWQLMQVERAFVEYLNADCNVPLAAHAYYKQGEEGTSHSIIHAIYMLGNSTDYSIAFTQGFGTIDTAVDMGTSAAKYLESIYTANTSRIGF